MDEFTQDETSEDVEAHGMKEVAAAGFTAAALAAGAGAASADAANAPAVHKAPQAHAAAMKKSDPTLKAHRQQGTMHKFFSRAATRANAMWKF